MACLRRTARPKRRAAPNGKGDGRGRYRSWWTADGAEKRPSAALEAKRPNRSKKITSRTIISLDRGRHIIPTQKMRANRIKSGYRLI